jgi:hypothetical protein
VGHRSHWAPGPGRHLWYRHILFKILIQIYKIIRYILTFFNNKINHTKIYDFLKDELDEYNPKNQWRQQLKYG